MTLVIFALGSIDLAMRQLLDQVLSPALLRPLFKGLAGFVLLMALLSHPPRMPLDRFGDKFEHMLAFALLTVVGLLGWPATAAWRIALRLSVFGAMIEVLQAIPFLHRDSDVRDWLADSLAIGLACLLVQFGGRFLPGRAAPGVCNSPPMP